MLLVGEKDAHITKAEATIRESESEIQQLREAVNRWGPVQPTIHMNFIL